MENKIKYEASTHHEQGVIFIFFDYDKDLNERVKKLVGVRWSQSKRAWYVPDNQQFRKRFGFETINAGTTTMPENISNINQIAYKKFIETLRLKAYSPSTLKTYCNEFAQLLYLLKNKNVDELDVSRLRSYFEYCTTTLKLSESTIHSRINAVKFYFEQVLGRQRFFVAIPRPKKRIILPNVLAISQVEQLFAKLENLKHKTMLFLAYSAGLRVSEVVNLRIKDIHSARMVINIKGAKGKKDRTVTLSEGILGLLRKYYLAYKPKVWLFEGQYGEDCQYSSRSLQQIFHRAKDSAKILQDVTFHSLRHSYATHLHERGTDIKLIQELLGHNDLKTTLRYTHVSTRTLEKIESPFDRLNIKV